LKVRVALRKDFFAWVLEASGWMMEIKDTNFLEATGMRMEKISYTQTYNQAMDLTSFASAHSANHLIVVENIIKKIGESIREEDRPMILVGAPFALVVLVIFLFVDIAWIENNIVLHVLSILVGTFALVLVFRKIYQRVGKNLSTVFGILGWITSVLTIIAWIVIQLYQI
jgi:hypothetical protein